MKPKKQGAKFPKFNLTDIDGPPITYEDFEGKVVVINFWFVGCAPCEVERPFLNELTQIYSDDADVIFVSFAKNEAEKLNDF